MSELQTLLDKAARAKSQGIVLNKPKAQSAQISKTPELKEKSEKWTSKKKYILAGVLCGIVAIGIGVYLSTRTSDTTDVTSLVAAVGKEITLPIDETPTVATVTDPGRLASQAFFKDAKVGDRVLIYSKAGKAILYRPSEKKVIAVGPLVSGK